MNCVSKMIHVGISSKLYSYKSIVASIPPRLSKLIGSIPQPVTITVANSCMPIHKGVIFCRGTLSLPLFSLPLPSHPPIPQPFPLEVSPLKSG